MTTARQGKEYEIRPSVTHILEIGAVTNPATDFYQHFPGAEIVIINRTPPKIFPSHEFDKPPLMLTGDPIEALLRGRPEFPKRGFNFILMANVFGGAPEFGQRLPEFMEELRRRLRPGGQFILEETYAAPVKYKESLRARQFLYHAFRNFGFETEIITTKQWFLAPRSFSYPSSFQVRARKPFYPSET